MSSIKHIVGIGEILIDKFPTYTKPGGAPCNVVYNASLLGNKATLVSATGDDSDGKYLRSFLNEHDIKDTFIQYSDKPTGTVNVTLKGDEASYEITESVAWDNIEWNKDLLQLTSEIDAVCFSTLSQRSTCSATTIHTFLESLPEHCLKVLDVNLRPPFYNKDVLAKSFSQADIIKLNEYEYELVGKLFDVSKTEEFLIHQFNVKEIILTLGKKGSVYFNKNYSIQTNTIAIDPSLGDSVGVGDAFISCIIHHKLQQTEPTLMLQKANRYAGMVASQKGAMASISNELLNQIK
jgi:fructokinase